jgi:hypothetical protein
MAKENTLPAHPLSHLNTIAQYFFLEKWHKKLLKTFLDSIAIINHL